MEQKRVYPYLIDEKRMSGYYELLLDDKFNLKIFSKKQDKEIYDYFLPLVRNYMFWTFEMNKVTEFKKMTNDLQSAVCGKYECNIFEKNDSTVVCFDSGICFAITSDEKIVKKLVKYEEKQKMEAINLREDESYDLPEETENWNQAHVYTYILQLYKMIYLKKLEKEIQDPNLFDKTRNRYVFFTQEIYDVKITDKDDICEKWKKELEIEKLHISIDNKFDLLYKNNKLNDNLAIKKICIILFVVLIIIGIINLGNWIG